MAAYLSTFKILLLVSVLFNSMACSSHAKKDEYSAITAAPLFEVTLHVPVEQGKVFFDTFRRYAESNNLVAFDLDDAPITWDNSVAVDLGGELTTLNNRVATDLNNKPATEDIRQGSVFQINDKRGYPLFVFDNFIFKNVFELAAYPSDIPLAQQHIYNLVQTLTATFRGRVELKSCNKAVLDCDRLIALLQPSCITCSLKVTEEVKPVVITISPVFTLKLNVPVDQEKHFIDTFLAFATSNNLAGISSQHDVSTPGAPRNYTDSQIMTEQKKSLFVIHNFLQQDEFELVAYPYDTPLVQQHIYNLVKTLTTNFHGRTELILCDAKVLDCARFKSLLQVK